MEKKRSAEKPPGPINRVIARLITDHGGNKAEIARKLSEKTEKPISGQLLGQYANTGKQPGSKFIAAWREVFGEDILELASETLVSREKGKSNLSFSEEREILIRNIDRIGETNEYLLKRIRELEANSSGGTK